MKQKKTIYRNNDMSVITIIEKRKTSPIIGMKLKDNKLQCMVFESALSAEITYAGYLYIGAQDEDEFTAPYSYICFGSLEEVEQQISSKLKEMLDADDYEALIF